MRTRGEFVDAMRHRAADRIRPRTHATAEQLAADAGRGISARFKAMAAAGHPEVALEIGSRARSGNVYIDWLPDSCRYVGFDVMAGPNVDVVGDAHQLSTYIEPHSVDVLWSVSTFEHLAMPWVAAVEIGKVLKPGGIAFIQSHQTWPVHDAPWDFWRFSTFAWDALFHCHSGFEIVEAGMGEPASVRADLQHPPTLGMERSRESYLLSAVIARKTGDSTLEWEVPLEDVLKGSRYPAGEVERLLTSS